MWKENDNKILKVLDEFLKKDAMFPAICPICGKKEGHVYLHKHSFDSQRGGLWLWCSACHHSSHSSYKVPLWWKNLETLDVTKLVSYPDYLESNKNEIDEWINKLKSNNLESHCSK